MEKFVIEGRQTLTGDVWPAGNKNAALPILAATLLTDEEVTLHNVPRIGDVNTMLSLLKEMGVEIRDGGTNLTLSARDAQAAALRSDLFQQIRGGMLLAGPMLARFGCAALPVPGGDRIGRRRVDTHLLALEALGATFEFTYDHYDFKACARPPQGQRHPARRDERDRHRECRDGCRARRGDHRHSQCRFRAARPGPLQPAQHPRRPHRGHRQQYTDDPRRRPPGRRRIHHLARLSGGRQFPRPGRRDTRRDPHPRGCAPSTCA